MRRAPLLLAGLLAVARVVAPVHAQQEDEQTREHAEQERRYLERYRQPTPPAKPADPASRDDERENAREAYLERAETLVRDRNYRGAGSERYRVQTDDPRLDPRVAVALLDAFRDYFDGFWGAEVDLRPYPDRSRVFLFYSFRDFNELLEGDFRFDTQRPKGHYGYAFDAITLHTDADRPGGVADALVHEAAHQLVGRSLYVGTHAPSLWISEGLASYFAFTVVDESMHFRRGEVGPKAVPLFRDGPRSSRSEAADRLKRFRASLGKRDAPQGSLVERVVSIVAPDEFYGESADLHYATSWMLVHYLLHDDDGAHAPGFARYMQREMAGQAGPQAFHEEIGLRPSELDAALIAHAGSIKVR